MVEKQCKYCDIVYYSLNIDLMAKHFYRKKGCTDNLRPICKICFKKFYVNEKSKAKNLEAVKKWKAKNQKPTNLLKDVFCQVCNKEFMQVRHNQLVCSEECRMFKNNVRKKIFYRENFIKINKRRAKLRKRKLKNG